MLGVSRPLESSAGAEPPAREGNAGGMTWVEWGRSGWYAALSSTSWASWRTCSWAAHFDLLRLDLTRFMQGDGVRAVFARGTRALSIQLRLACLDWWVGATWHASRYAHDEAPYPPWRSRSRSVTFGVGPLQLEIRGHVHVEVARDEVAA